MQIYQKVKKKKKVIQIIPDSLTIFFKQDIILPGSKVILTAVGQCWSDQIFLYGLSHRFWKLTLQLIIRYNVWASEIASNPINIGKVY